MRSSWLIGRLAVVTGASRGIGAATAAALADAGAHVVLAARDRAALDEVTARIKDAGGKATPMPTDVADEAAVERLFSEVNQIGQVSALVCAAGVLTNAPFAATTSKMWHETLGVNLTGTFFCCRAAFTAMASADAGAGPDRHHRLAVRRLRHGEVPRPRRVQRLQIRRHRAHRGDRGRGQGAWHQRHLPEPGCRRHRDAAQGESGAASRPDPG